MRIEQLTFTRFIASISIVIFHYGSGSFLFNNEYVSFIFRQANVGVSYFFILSGFVMIIAYQNKTKINFIEYIKNRLARIYPLYFLAIVLVLGINFFRNINYLDLVLNLLMIQTWIHDKALTINFPGWSLSIELFFYVAFPILLNNLYSKLKLKTITVWILTFWFISQIVFHLLFYKVITFPYYDLKDITYHPIMHFNEFLIGNLAGLFFISKLKHHSKNYLLVILVFLFFLFLLLKYPFGLNFHNGLLSLVFVPLILFISLSNDKITRLFSHEKFIFLGEISFGIYILQFPIWTILSDLRMEKYLGFQREADFTISFLIRFSILIILSSLSYLYVEKPLRNKIIK